jgi:hypothetical protein
VAFQLALQPILVSQIAEALDGLTIEHCNVLAQFQKLIEQPFWKITGLHTSLIIVYDALDEYGTGTTQTEFLAIVHLLISLPPVLKFVMTRCPGDVLHFYGFSCPSLQSQCHLIEWDVKTYIHIWLSKVAHLAVYTCSQIGLDKRLKLTLSDGLKEFEPLLL